MSESKQITLLKHQVAFLASQKRFVAMCGGFGCGKSYGLAAKAYQLASVNHGFQGALISRTSRQLNDFLLPEIHKFFMEVGAPYAMKDGNKIILDWGADKTTLHLLTTENDAYLRWAGGNWAFALIDEIDTMPKAEDVWSFANDRIRVKAPLLQTACASTPEGFGFLYNFFDQQPRENTSLRGERELIKGCTFDNPYLDESYVRAQIQTRNPLQLKAYVYGDFVLLDGSPVYWRFDQEINSTSFTLTDFPQHVLHIGQDFNKGINAGVVSVIKNNQAYAVDELYGYKDTQQLSEAIKQRYPWHFANNCIRFYPDASGFEGIQNLKRNFAEHSPDGQPNFRFSAANPPVDKRIAAVNEKFGVKEAFVNTKRCPELYRGLCQQTYVRNQPDKSSGIDHSLDGFGYFMHRVWPLTGQVTARVM